MMRQKHIVRSGFHGGTVWFGVAMALVGFLAQEWRQTGINFSPIVFFGGLQIGMGVTWNHFAALRRAESRAD